jgi:protein subunit release factor A
MHSSLRGVLWMGGAVLSFSAMAVAARELLAHMQPFQILFVRSAIMMAIVLLVVAQADPAAARTRRLPLHVLRNVIHFGGQHVNKTDSAIRMTHLPSGIVVQCQSDRSQHKNRAEALAMLKSKLFEMEMRKKQAERQKLEDSKTDIGWGHQIRSYVLDQSRIKDLRTGVEKGATQSVLDGDLDDFIEASLKQGV